ncbi:hypothetical protein [Flavobacterium sp. TAB 87]|uniref:hypothetical protein n=1 Tax=Flavobacterium sp. TAB 87 TaxID=1729581 RepID=UPI00076D8C31|nr:hypothetical protein [Flavobacterium sp. TAB 87]KVV13413.1 hypothetical protein AP058_02776 [Flavobacterium sp. TAB 87]
MENTNEKIANLRVQVSEKCTEREKSIIELYWKFDSLEFLSTAKNIMKTFEISQNQLNGLISSCGLLLFSIPCGSCTKSDDMKVSSRSDFKSILNQAPFTTSSNSTYKCSFCISKEQEEAHLKNVQEQKKINQNLEKGIEAKNWQHLTNFQKGMLQNCFKMTFLELKKHYRNILSQDKWMLFIESLEVLESHNLLSLQRDSNKKEIMNYNYLDKLPSFKDEISIKKEATKSSFEIDAQTNELKFKLITNKDQNYPDSPAHSGTIIFNQEIVIMPEVEYVYGLWKRANGNLYLTMMPIENFELLPANIKFSEKSIRLQNNIASYLKETSKKI